MRRSFRYNRLDLCLCLYFTCTGTRFLTHTYSALSLLMYLCLPVSVLVSVLASVLSDLVFIRMVVVSTAL